MEISILTMFTLLLIAVNKDLAAGLVAAPFLILWAIIKPFLLLAVWPFKKAAKCKYNDFACLFVLYGYMFAIAAAIDAIFYN